MVRSLQKISVKTQVESVSTSRLPATESKERIERARRLIDRGLLDTEDRLEKAVDGLLRDLMADQPSES